MKASGHDIEGTVAFAPGQVRFDPDTGAASGEVTIDVRRARTENRVRDLEMHRSVLETERFPMAVFRPNLLRDRSRQPGRSTSCWKDFFCCTVPSPPSASPSSVSRRVSR